MALVEWPWPLPYQSLRDGMKPQPPELRARTDFDAGPARARRRSLVAPWKNPVLWLFTLDEFELFQSFWKESLADGAAWFAMPVFIGRDYVVSECRFVDLPQPSLKGVTWRVAATLEVQGRATMTRAEANDRWPGSIV